MRAAARAVAKTAVGASKTLHKCHAKQSGCARIAGARPHFAYIEGLSCGRLSTAIMKKLSINEVTVLQVLVDQMDERRLVNSIYELESFERTELDGLLESLAGRHLISVHEGKPADGPFLSWVAHGGRGRAEHALRSAKAPDIKT
jgi:hypothetical protein